MAVIAYIAYGFWSILGFLFWVPLLVRVVAAFCAGLAYNMVIQNPGAIQNSRISLELAISFYAKGFSVIYDTIFDPGKKSRINPTEEFHLSSFLAQLGWTILFWGLIFYPLFR